MPLRKIELILPAGCDSKVESALEDQPIVDHWSFPLNTSKVIHHLLIRTHFTESISDLLNHKFSGYDHFRINISTVDATLPTPEKQPKSTTEENKDAQAGLLSRILKPGHSRVSREELYFEIANGNEVSLHYIAMVSLSAIVAAIGLLKNDVAIIIGAMVIAPLLKPNVALALASVLRDWPLAKKSLLANIAGFNLALILAAAMGYFIDVDITAAEIAGRTHVTFAHIVLALASGTAGALAFTTGASSTLIGVMVAVALMPPLVTLGLLLGSGHWIQALGAYVLFLANVASVNLAALATFKIQGIKPMEWWHHEQASKSSKATLLFWSLLLAALCLVIAVTNRL